jgi:uncharacterized membrane protein YgcG
MIQDFYKDTCTIYSRGLTGKTNRGFAPRQLALKYPNIPCWVTDYDEAGTELTYAGKDNLDEIYLLFCDPINLISTDVILTDAILGYPVYYEIIMIDDANDMHHHLEIQIKYLDSPMIMEGSSTSSNSTSSSGSSDSSSSSSNSSSSSSSGSV